MTTRGLPGQLFIEQILGEVNTILRVSAEKFQQPGCLFKKLLSSSVHLHERITSVATMPEWLVMATITATCYERIQSKRQGACCQSSELLQS